MASAHQANKHGRIPTAIKQRAPCRDQEREIVSLPLNGLIVQSMSKVPFWRFSHRYLTDFVRQAFLCSWGALTAENSNEFSAPFLKTGLSV
jgi:hypothetical protein